MQKEVIKAKAKALRAFLQARGLELNHSGALEAVAHIEGTSSYNVLQAKAAPAPAPVTLASIPTWDIEVTRIGYAHRTIQVKGARSAQEAARLAAEELDSGNFSEHDSEYQLSSDPDPHQDATDDIVVLGEEVLSEPQTWQVVIGRISYGVETLKVWAPSEAQAQDRALDIAGNTLFNLTTFKYEVDAFPGPLPL